MGSTDRMVKIAVKLNPDEDGYPPVDWEGLWAFDLGNQRYRLDSIPFYAPDLSSGDLVLAGELQGQITFMQLIEHGGHSTVRVVSHDENQVRKLRDDLRALGFPSELSNIPSLFAIDVAPSANYKALLEILYPLFEAGEIDYEESALRH